MENLLKVKENDADRDENDESKSGKKDEGKVVDNLHSDKGKDLVRSSDVSIPKKNPSISLPKSLPIPKNIPSITSISFKPNPMLVIEERKEEEEATAETMNLNDSSKRSPLVTAKKESETVGSKVGESSGSRLNEEEGKEGKDVEVQTDNLENSTLTTQPNSLCASITNSSSFPLYLPLFCTHVFSLSLSLTISLSASLHLFYSHSLNQSRFLIITPSLSPCYFITFCLPYIPSFLFLFLYFLMHSFILLFAHYSPLSPVVFLFTSLIFFYQTSFLGL